jgi:hypothetical protein
VCAISLAASIFLSARKAGLLAIAWPISSALLASPCVHTKRGQNSSHQKAVLDKREYQKERTIKALYLWIFLLLRGEEGFNVALERLCDKQVCELAKWSSTRFLKSRGF